MDSLKQRYQKVVVPELARQLDISNPHQIPAIAKIVLNVGLGQSRGEAKLVEVATNTLRKISGQQPVTTIAKHSIAAFKLRAGQPIGLKVTLRGQRMYGFLDRLIRVVIPRMRDFHGLATSSFDKSGNYTIGINDQSIFPELSYEDTATTHGLEITIVTSTDNRQWSEALLRQMGLPLEPVQEATRG